MERQRLLEQWNSFRQATILSADPTSAQYIDMRRAFYGGALAMHTTLLNGVTENAENFEIEMQMLSDLHDELLKFARMVREGKA